MVLRHSYQRPVQVDVVDATDADSKGGLTGFGHMYYTDSPQVMHDIVQVLGGVFVSKRGLINRNTEEPLGTYDAIAMIDNPNKRVTPDE